MEWVESVRKFLPLVRQNPQVVHTGISRSLQHKWAYLQQVIEVDPEKYAVLDEVIQAELILALFNADEIPAEFDQLFTLPVKHAGIGILSPTVESGMNRETCVASTTHLVDAILQEHELNLQDHDWMMNRGRWEGKLQKNVRYENIYSEVCAPLSPDFKQDLEERAKEEGDWLNMLPQYKNNNVLDKGEFWDGLLL
eukprot:7837234-Ditylum_brightwellii.AAC.1